MSHRIIIINGQTPDSSRALLSATSEPEFRVSVEYRPPDALTASQIGNEVARIQRRVSQIIEGTSD